MTWRAAFENSAGRAKKGAREGTRPRGGLLGALGEGDIKDCGVGRSKAEKLRKSERHSKGKNKKGSSAEWTG